MKFGNTHPSLKPEVPVYAAQPVSTQDVQVQYSDLA